MIFFFFFLCYVSDPKMCSEQSSLSAGNQSGNSTNSIQVNHLGGFFFPKLVFN